MQTIGESKLWSVCPDSGEMTERKCTEIRKGKAFEVKDYLELANKVASLQYVNRDHVILFRGQNSDHTNRQKNTSIKPTIFRGHGSNPTSDELALRFERLQRAEQLLVNAYKKQSLPRAKEIERRRILRWSILQHYRICDTPLVDVTHSLRVAASFATHGADEKAYLFALGVPQIAGAVTTSAESEIQVIRLASVCPPQAVRPHIQEGYLLGEYPEIFAYEQKALYEHHEVDFGQRLIAKFTFNVDNFWSPDAFPCIPKEALYPADRDPIKAVIKEITDQLGS